MNSTCDSGRHLAPRRKIAVADVAQARGRELNKELRMTPAELEDLLRSLLDRQSNRCALTGIRFHFTGQKADTNLRPSVDRIDSNGHYEHENIQIVCRFVNFWKSDTNNEEFKRLLMLVRDVDGISA